MHSSSAAPPLRPRKLALAMLPLAFASGALLINPRPVLWIDSLPNWRLLALALVAAALLARAFGARLLGAADGPVLARRSLVALWVLGLLGLVLSGRLPGLTGAGLLFGAPLALSWALVWRPWMRRQRTWFALALAAGLGAIWLVYADASPLSEVTVPFVARGLGRGLLVGGGLWLLSAPAALWLARPADAGEWLDDPDGSRAGRRLGLAGWSLLAAALLYAVAAQGLQSCRWLDLAAGRSGCMAGLYTGDANPQSMALTPDGATLFVLDYDTLHRIPLDSFAIEQSVPLRETFVTQEPVTVTERLLAEQVAVTPDGSQVLVTGSRTVEETYVLRYATAGMQPLPTVAFTDYLGFMPLAVSRDSQRVSLARRQWRLSDGAELERIGLGDLRDYVLRDMSYADDVFSPDSSALAQENLSDIEIYRTGPDMEPAERLAVLEGALAGFERQHNYKVFSPDSSLLAVVTEDPEAVMVSVWEIASGRRLASFPFTETTYGEPAVVFAPDNASLLIHNEGWIGRYRIR